MNKDWSSKIMKKSKKKYIHVNQHKIRANNEKPILPCGARVVIETTADIEIA